MSISMIGIDHNRAPVDIRALFALTRKNAGEAMEEIQKEDGILGCILLSTCNRMELWVSVPEDWEGCLYEQLCRLKGIREEKYRTYYTERSGKEAVEHLFYLTS